MSTLIELIFKGQVVKVDFSFLERYFGNSTNIVLNFPEKEISSYEEVVGLLKADNYVNIVINDTILEVYSKIVKNVFVDITVDSGFIDLLYFFDYKDVGIIAFQDVMNILRKWSMEHRDYYNFEYIICQSDNGGADEYYFDNEKFGPLFFVNNDLS